MDSDLSRIVRRQSVLFVIISLALSIALIVAGFQFRDGSLYGSVLGALGAGALGACIGILLSGFLDAAPLTQVRRLIQDSLDSEIYSSDERISEYRNRWHSYIYTVVNGEGVWRYRVIDFSDSHVPRKLLADFETPRPFGSGKIKYRIEGFLIGNRLLFVQKAKIGTEQPVIYLFPSAGEFFKEYHSGYNLLTTYEERGLEIMGPSLLSQRPLIDSKIGTVEIGQYETLYTMWRDGLPLENRLPLSEPGGS